MLRPSLPMIRPFISSDGSGSTVIAACELVPTARRWTAVVTIRRARDSAVRRACASVRRTWAAVSFSAWAVIRAASSERASSAVTPETDSSSARTARSASASLRATSLSTSSRSRVASRSLAGHGVEPRRARRAAAPRPRRGRRRAPARGPRCVGHGVRRPPAGRAPRP